MYLEKLASQLQLVLDQFKIASFHGQKFCVRARLDDLPPVQHNDLVSIYNGAQPVGNYHDGSVLEEIFQVLDDLLFIVGI